VQRCGAYVAQSTGDGIFALFGAPVAHEDRPQRALFAVMAAKERLFTFRALAIHLSRRSSESVRFDVKPSLHYDLGRVSLVSDAGGKKA
jgi:class 3 adenylate cyclase